MKVLITGGAGFIGFHLSNYLSRQGFDVLSIDSLSDYYAKELKNIRIENFENSLHFLKVDLSDENQIANVFNNYDFDIVIHLAAQPGIRLGIDGMKKYTQNNLVSFSNICTHVVNKNIKLFLFASSSSVYGNSMKFPYDENELKLQPTSIYGATKLANEILARSIFTGTKTKTFGLRFFTVYGSFGRPDMSYFRLFNSALNGVPFKMFGDGSSLRDFTFVEDVVLSIEKLIESSIKLEEGTFEILNVGGGNPISMTKLCEHISSICGNEIKIIREKKDHQDVLKTEASFVKLEKLISYHPDTRIEIGLQKTFKWFQNKQILSNLNNWVDSVL